MLQHLPRGLSSPGASLVQYVQYIYPRKRDPNKLWISMIRALLGKGGVIVCPAGVGGSGGGSGWLGGRGSGGGHDWYAGNNALVASRSGAKASWTLASRVRNI